jgi:hypothetical protein
MPPRLLLLRLLLLLLLLPRRPHADAVVDKTHPEQLAWAGPDAEKQRVSVEPRVSCPGSSFDVLWNRLLAKPYHWIGVSKAAQPDHLLYWCTHTRRLPPASP